MKIIIGAMECTLLGASIVFLSAGFVQEFAACAAALVVLVAEDFRYLIRSPY